MKKTILFVLLAFFLQNATAQRRSIGIVSVARYNAIAPPILDESDGLPEFDGGIEAFQKAFKSAFIFPEKSLESEQGGEGMIGFTVDTLGNIQDIEVIDSISPEIDAEALYVFSQMKPFKPMWKPMKLAILYHAFPSIYKDELRTDELDALLKSKKPSEWRTFLDKKKPYAILSAQLGVTVPTDALTRTLRPFFQIGGNLEVFKNRWGGGFTGTLRASTIRKNFEYNNDYWDKDSSVSLHSAALYVAYRLVEEDRLTFTPFVGFSANFLLLTDESYDYTPKIISFLPTIGASVDLNHKQNTVNDWGTTRLNTTIVRFRFAVNFANFKDGRQGNIVDFGLGIGWFTRQILVK
jgi:Gram-negative bacterial TonB protein C-terminal